LYAFFVRISAFEKTCTNSFKYNKMILEDFKGEVTMIPTEYVTNGIGLALMIMFLITNSEHFVSLRRTKYLLALIIITAVTCIDEILSYMLNGKQGTFYTVVLYIIGFWTFLANILMSYYWIKLECQCIGVKLHKAANIAILVLDALGVLVLIANFFYPLVFKYENNVYERCDFFWVTLAIGGLNILFALAIYIFVRLRGRLLIPFRMFLFVIPLILGIVIQSVTGLVVIWIGVGIGIVGMASSLKNQLIFLDPLTGVFNRTYLEQVSESVNDKGVVNCTGIMVDINNFKTINDVHGHLKGDEALKVVSNIFTKAVDYDGNVIRTGGDEFIIMIDSTDESVVNRITDKITADCAEFTRTNETGYILAVSMGVKIFNNVAISFDDFLKELDQRMYEKKQEYHRLHPSESSR